MSWLNALFPEEGWLAKAKAAYTGMGATPNQLLGPAPGNMQFVSDADRQSFVPMAQAQRAERAKRAKQQGEDFLGFVGGLRAYHGSPWKFDKFRMSEIGTGEGAQVKGHGLYFAENPFVAEWYREKLGRNSPIPTDVLARYYKPGEVVPSFGGQDRVLAFDPKTRTVTVQAVEYGTGKPIEPPRIHSTQPDLAHITQSFRMRGERPYIPGHMYEVDIKTEPNRLLDWDKPFPQQSSYVQGQLGDFVEQKVQSMNAARERARPKVEEKIRKGLPLSKHEQEILLDMSPERIPGSKIYSMQEVAQGAMRPGEKGAETAEYFRKNGIPGIQYLDQGSRTAGHGTRNYVVFDDNLIDILRRYGTLGPVGAGVVNQLTGGQSDARE